MILLRPMLVMGHALLKHVIFCCWMEQAASSVDFETDKAIQRTLRETFQMIAHQINNIVDSDKILMMKDGYVAEYAPPQELWKDELFIFAAQSEED